MHAVSSGNRKPELSDSLAHGKEGEDSEAQPLLRPSDDMSSNKTVLTTRPTTSDELRRRRTQLQRSKTEYESTEIELPGSMPDRPSTSKRPSTSNGRTARRLGSANNWQETAKRALEYIEKIDETDEQPGPSNLYEQTQLPSPSTEEERKSDDVPLIKDSKEASADSEVPVAPKKSVKFGNVEEREHEPLEFPSESANVPSILDKVKRLARGKAEPSTAAPKGSTGMSREQHAFLNKFGMRMEDAEQQQGPRFEGSIFKFIREEFIVDPTHDYTYYWNGIVATAYLYNLFFVPYRCVFLVGDVPQFLFYIFIFLDIVTDLIYAVDLFFRSRTGYLEQGLLVRDKMKTWKAYKRSWLFVVDILGTIPIDYACEIVLRNPNPFLRFNRLLKLDRIQDYINATETRISIPNVFRISCVVMYILVLIHWNACFYFLVSLWLGIGSDSWVYGETNTQALPPGVEDNLGRRYIYSFYWSTLMLTTVGEVPWPVRSVELVIVIVDLMCGVLIFATIVGNVGTMISNMSAARSDFQNRVDGIKKYMEMRNISPELEDRVIKWFDYLWSNKQTVSDQHVLQVLPTKLQAEIAMHVHFETLRKVRIFQDCEAGLLAELVLKLELQVFSPNDFVCRKGDIGREMYIVKKGRLQVVNDDGTQVFHTLQEGAVFGELSILNIAGSKQGNRRSASIRSVGYTDLFVLKKTDLWEALKEYPDARKILIQKGKEILMKDNLLDESRANQQRNPEELALELQRYVNDLQNRLARLTAQHVSNETKLRLRIEQLERELRIQDEGFFDENEEIALENQPSCSGLQEKKDQ
ncbi:unnamed protein product [Bursaphelenchus xylophilus]|uniref:(pine wood nematode) hypothetical protein n=1 Tax=Bursaphelenchus xylophilus TaxID=6326 RepID=A0A1I7SEY4_BURXY|nr:unnamed protein product [Bursaphelenchus xylophilus]CAG9113705.1 unnamed protein product [Bursaphelenchus xylophilus]